MATSSYQRYAFCKNCGSDSKKEKGKESESKEGREGREGGMEEGQEGRKKNHSLLITRNTKIHLNLTALPSITLTFVGNIFLVFLWLFFPQSFTCSFTFAQNHLTRFP